MPDIVNMTSTHVVGVFTGNESRTALDNPNLNLNPRRLRRIAKKMS